MVINLRERERERERRDQQNKKDVGSKNWFCCWLREAKDQVCLSVFVCVCSFRGRSCSLTVFSDVFVYPSHNSYLHSFKFYLLFLNWYDWHLFSLFVGCSPICGGGGFIYNICFSFQPPINFNDTTHKFIGSWTGNQDARVNKNIFYTIPAFHLPGIGSFQINPPFLICFSKHTVVQILPRKEKDLTESAK